MSNIASDLNNLVNNLNTTFNNISGTFNTTQTTILNNTYVKKNGDILSGVLDLNSNKIINISNGTNTNDAVNFSQLPKKLSDLTIANTSDISLNSFKLTNVANGSNTNDAVNYSQVNTLINTAITNNKIYKLITTTDFFINVDLSKPHIFNLSYNTGGTTNADNNYFITLYTHPLIDNIYLPYRTLTTSINLGYLTNNSTAVAINLITISLVNGVLKIVPSTGFPNNIQCYEM